MAKPLTSKFKMISLSQLAAQAKIPKSRFWFNLNGVSNTFSFDEKVRIVNTLYKEVNKFFNLLGYELPPPREL